MTAKRIRAFFPVGLAMIVVAVGTTAAAARSGNPADQIQLPAAPAVTVFVTNNNWMDVNVYAFSGGKRHRLGMVAGNSSGKFVIPSWVIEGHGDLRLIADPIGSRRGVATHPVIVHPGDIIEYRVEYSLDLSSVMVIPGS